MDEGAEEALYLGDGEFAVQAGAGDQEAHRRVHLAACGQGQGVGQWALEGWFVASCEDVAAHVQEVDRRWFQVAYQVLELAYQTLGAVVRVDQGEGVREFRREPGRVDPAGAMGRASVGTDQTCRVRGSRCVKSEGARGPGSGSINKRSQAYVRITAGFLVPYRAASSIAAATASPPPPAATINRVMCPRLGVPATVPHSIVARGYSHLD